MADETLSDAIEETARGPAKVSVDGMTVEAHDLAKLVQADQHLAGKRAARRNHLGLYFIKLQPPGAG